MKCEICGIERLDLSKHLMSSHNISVKKYKEKYGKGVQDKKINLKRKATNLELYGDENYRNREAIKLSNEIYDGGYSLSDPEIRDKGKKTKEKKYGDSNYTNREQAKETNLRKYGYENPNSVPQFIEKRVATNLQRYGRVFNYTKESKPIPRDLEGFYSGGMTLSELSFKYKVSEALVSKWVLEKSLSRVERDLSNEEYVCRSECPLEAVREVNTLLGKCDRSTIKDIKGFPEKTWNLERQYGSWNAFLKAAGVNVGWERLSPKIIVREYLEYCNNKMAVLSFYGFSREVKDMRKNLRLKRLFGKGKKYHHLNDELKKVALKPELWADFLLNLG